IFATLPDMSQHCVATSLFVSRSKANEFDRELYRLSYAGPGLAKDHYADLRAGRQSPGLGSFRACLGGRFPGVRPGMRPGGLPRPRRGLGPQPLDLTPWQGDADLADPFQPDPVDRLGVETGEVDDAGGLSPLDRFQVALAGLQPDRGLFSVEARNRMMLLPAN